MQEAGSKEARFPITYFDGVNATVQPTLAKRTELSHAENVRSPQIGVIQKREGYAPKGTSPQGNRFVATANYGLTRFPTTSSSQQGIFRISSSGEPTQTLTLSVFDWVAINEAKLDNNGGARTASPSTTDFQTYVVDFVTISEPSLLRNLDGNTTTLNSSVTSADIYYLTTAETWVKLSDTDAQSITGGQFDFTVANQNLIIVNGNDKNRQLSSNGSTVITSTDAGNLYNSPHAHRVCFYKSRIHLADYVKNGVRYPTTILRSSYPLGIISLVDGDHASAVTSVSVTDSKYFYAASGMNSYDVYRGGTKITTLTVTGVNETSIAVSSTGAALLSSDEIWIAGTFEGAKQFRWVNNPTASGRDVKQYDTFRLSGGDEDPITLFDTVGNVILIGNHNTLATWDDYTLQQMDLKVGCSSPNGSAKLLGTMYFIHYSGVYATTGGLPTLISRKVERYIKGATLSGLENAAVGIMGLSVFFSIGDSTLYKEDGSVEKTLQDVTLEYSVGDQNWYVHTNMPIKEFENFTSTDGVERMLGTHEGNSKSVMDLLQNSVFTDDGSEIFMRADTQEIQLIQEFEMFANPLAIVTETKRGSQLKCYINPDDDGFYEMQGTIKKGISTIKVTSRDATKMQPVICRKIKLSYRDSSKQRPRINQTALIYLPTVMDEPPGGNDGNTA